LTHPCHGAGHDPDCDLERVHAVGNAAGDGARIALLNVPQRQEAVRLAGWVEHVQTATAADFQDEFVAAMALPHARDAFPHLSGDSLPRGGDRRPAARITQTTHTRKRGKHDGRERSDEIDTPELIEKMQDDLYDGLADEILAGVHELLRRAMTPYDILTKVLVGGMDIVVRTSAMACCSCRRSDGGQGHEGWDGGPAALLAETGAPRSGRWSSGR